LIFNPIKKALVFFGAACQILKVSMNLEPALCSGIIICEKIIREAGTGKYNLINCFNNFNTMGFPLMSIPFNAFVMLTNFKGSFDSINVTLRIENPKTGQVFFNSVGNVKLKEGTNLQGNEILEVPFQITPFIIPEAGVYLFVILVDNEPIGKRSFTVTALTSGTPQVGHGG
jgi:Family of unknown function (DUF6941)